MLEHIVDIIKPGLAHWSWPFMLATNNLQNAGKVNTTRIIEALLIAGITAAASGYVSMSVMEEKMDFFQHAVEENQAAIKKNADNLTAHMQWEFAYEAKQKDDTIRALQEKLRK